MKSLIEELAERYRGAVHPRRDGVTLHTLAGAQHFASVDDAVASVSEPAP